MRLFSSVTSNNKFWGYGAFEKELIVCGYLNEIDTARRPLEIIKLIYSFYHVLPLSFGYFENTHLSWKTVKSSDSSIIEANKDENICVRPSATARWGEKAQLITANKVTGEPLKYTMSIECMEGFSTNNVYFGAAEARRSNHRRYVQVNGKTQLALEPIMV